MAPYAVDTMSRKDLRKCYNRYAFAVMLLFPLSQLTGYGLVLGGSYLLRPWLSDPDWWQAFLSVVNALSAYVPAAAVFLLLLRRFPRSEKLPVDRLGLWELLRVAMLCLGVCLLLNLFTLQLVNLLSTGVGLEASNRVIEHEKAFSLENQVIFAVLVPPVCEELLFRRLLLDRLRALGDVSAVFLSALAFAFFHANLYQMFYAFGLGIIFAVVVLLTGSIRDTILLHMLINGSTLLNSAMAEYPWYSLFYGLFLSVCMVYALFYGLHWSRRIHTEPGPLALSPRDKRRACLGSVWFWLMVFSSLAISTVIIFR